MGLIRNTSDLFEASNNGIEEIGISFDSVRIVSLAALMALTLVSNCLSILAILTRKRKISRMYYFLLHLSLADILTGLLTLGPELLWAPMEEFIKEARWMDMACKSAKYLQLLAPYLR